MKKTAVVTGGAGGIGEAVCRKLAGDGYNIIIHYNKSEKKAEMIATEIAETYGVTTLTVKSDLSADGQGKALAEAVAETEISSGSAPCPVNELISRLSYLALVFRLSGFSSAANVAVAVAIGIIAAIRTATILIILFLCFLDFLYLFLKIFRFCF